MGTDDVAGIVALRSDNTNHEAGDGEEYEHINILKPIGQVLMSDVRKLRNEIVLSETELGDAVSALVVAIQMIKETCKKVSDLSYHIR
jgi:ATP-dependent DNA helicase 2 subunit 2